MTDMHNGKVWHEPRTGIKWKVSNYGTVHDTALSKGTERKLTDFCFGLHLLMNIDWRTIFFTLYLAHIDLGLAPSKIACTPQVLSTSP